MGREITYFIYFEFFIFRGSYIFRITNSLIWNFFCLLNPCGPPQSGGFAAGQPIEEESNSAGDKARLYDHHFVILLAHGQFCTQFHLISEIPDDSPNYIGTLLLIIISYNLLLILHNSVYNCSVVYYYLLLLVVL